ncbi:MAG: SLC13 family permease [Coriobacteriales bacterium]|jgi:Na+/H+ antiporter NhaD/arsenite permease-like protein
MTPDQIIAILVFVIVMALIVSDKVHQALAALAGAVVLLVTGVLSFDAAVESIDFNTIGVLCGMMMFVAVVKSCGIFEYIAIRAAKAAKGNPWMIMVYFVIITAVLSALLDNVTTILLLGPMTIMVCKILDENPVPYFLAEVMASNIGGTSTLIGDPPNIMIGSEAGLSFFDFLQYNGPIIVIILVALLLVYRFKYGRKMKVDPEAREKVMALDENEVVSDPRLMKISIAMIILVAVAFMFHGSLGISSSVIALTAACIIMFLGKFNIEEALKGVEWGTIAFLLGLFVVVGALNDTGVIAIFANWIFDVTGGNTVLAMIVILWVSALLSSILNNIPFVATVIPIIMALQASGMDVYPLWWALSLGVCLGGNGTLVGASANVVLAAISEKEGHPISFIYFFKQCFPIMIMSIALCTVYLLVLF